MQINTSKFPKEPCFMHILPWFFQQSGKQLHVPMALDEAMLQKKCSQTWCLLRHSVTLCAHVIIRFIDWLTEPGKLAGTFWLLSLPCVVWGFPCLFFEFVIILVTMQWISFRDGLRWVLHGKNYNKVTNNAHNTENLHTQISILSRGTYIYRDTPWQRQHVINFSRRKTVHGF